MLVSTCPEQGYAMRLSISDFFLRLLNVKECHRSGPLKQGYAMRLSISDCILNVKECHRSRPLTHHQTSGGMCATSQPPALLGRSTLRWSSLVEDHACKYRASESHFHTVQIVSGANLGTPTGSADIQAGITSRWQRCASVWQDAPSVQLCGWE